MLNSQPHSPATPLSCPFTPTEWAFTLSSNRLLASHTLLKCFGFACCCCWLCLLILKRDVRFYSHFLSYCAPLTVNQTPVLSLHFFKFFSSQWLILACSVCMDEYGMPNSFASFTGIKNAGILFFPTFSL